MTVALLCGSRKPAPGLDSRSAAREMLREVGLGLRSSGAPTVWVDLRDYDLPHWDGRDADAYGAADLDRLRSELDRATAVVVSAPAYWNALSGVLVNAIDLVGDAPLRGKLVGLVIVGMDTPSAWHGAAQMRALVQGLGAWCPPEEVVVGNPREHADVAGLRRDLRRYGAYLGLLLTGRLPAFSTLAQEAGGRWPVATARPRLGRRQQDEATARLVEQLAGASVLAEGAFPVEAFHELRARVHEAFEVPETSITPMMARALFAVAASVRPRAIVGIGTYAGNGLVWLAGPTLCRPPWHAATTITGCDVDPEATALARANFARLDAGAPVDLVCADGHDVLAASRDPIDLLYLDADRPGDRKGIYRSLLEVALPRLRPGAVVLAHDAVLPLFADALRPYLGFVRDPNEFRVSLALAVDDCGVELSVR